jgi:hypothetical protein
MAPVGFSATGCPKQATSSALKFAGIEPTYHAPILNPNKTENYHLTVRIGDLTPHEIHPMRRPVAALRDAIGIFSAALERDASHDYALMHLAEAWSERS